MIPRESIATLLKAMQASHDPVSYLHGAFESFGATLTGVNANAQAEAKQAREGLATIGMAINQAAGVDPLARNLLHLVATTGVAVTATHVADLILSMARARLEVDRMVTSRFKAGQLPPLIYQRIPIGSTEADEAWARFKELRSAHPDDAGEHAAFRIALATLLMADPPVPSDGQNRAS